MRMRLLKKNNDKEVQREALKIIKTGGLVVSPTDTVYGLLTDATNERAVKKLIQFKNRPWGKPISVFVSDFKMLEHQGEADSKQMKVLRELLPGPFTVILKSRHRVSPLLESEKGTLGIRFPRYQFIEGLVESLGNPITATSANISGRHAHYSVQTLLAELSEPKKKLIDLVVDAGNLPRNKPSTIVDLTSDRLKLMRQGDIVFKDKKTYSSNSPEQTKKIAQFIFQKIVDKKKPDKPLVFIIKGELGVGKTIFVKGIGEFLEIKDIVSPTFVVYYEYEVKISNLKSQISNLVHVDLYNVQDKEEFKYLGLEKYLKRGNVMCFEWGEKAGEIIDRLKSKAKIVYVDMKYIDEREREIIIEN